MALRDHRARLTDLLSRLSPAQLIALIFAADPKAALRQLAADELARQQVYLSAFDASAAAGKADLIAHIAELDAITKETT